TGVLGSGASAPPGARAGPPLSRGRQRRTGQHSLERTKHWNDRPAIQDRTFRSHSEDIRWTRRSIRDPVRPAKGAAMLTSTAEQCGATQLPPAKVGLVKRPIAVVPSMTARPTKGRLDDRSLAR